MNKVYPNQEIISLFCPRIPSQSSKMPAYQALNKRGLAFAVIGAFFIVITAAILLNFLAQKINIGYPQAQAYSGPVAYQPGNYIAEQVNQGYLNN